MTSPAQLKYLNAMGVPVWVSRDLIIESDEIVDIVEVSTESNEHQNSLNQSSPSHSKQYNSSSVTSENTNSALGLLSTLEEQDKKVTIATTPAINENSIQADNHIQSQSASVEKALENSQDRATAVDEKAPIVKKANSVNLHSQTANHYIYASGSEQADWMVIGHSPEPFNGVGDEPFASESGVLLNNMLRAVGLEDPREQSYIANVLDINKSVELDTQIQKELKEKLLSMIDKIQPKVILLVGQNSAQNLLGLNDPLIIMRSKVHHITENNIPCIVTYYPSYLLHKTTDKRKAWNDLKLAMSQIV